MQVQHSCKTICNTMLLKPPFYINLNLDQSWNILTRQHRSYFYIETKETVSLGNLPRKRFPVNVLNTKKTEGLPVAVRQRSTPHWVRNYYEADEASSPRRRLRSPRNPAVPSPSSLIPLSSSSKSTERQIDSDYAPIPLLYVVVSQGILSSFSFPRSTRTLRCRSLGESTSSERPAPSDTASLGLPPPAN